MAKLKLPKDSREKFKSARDFIQARDVESARSRLLEVELGSSFSLFHRLMAACAYIDNDFELACSHIEQAIALDPDKQVLIADAIRIYRTQGDDKRAKDLLESFNLEKTQTSSELMRIAQAYKSYQCYQDAATALENALRLSPDNVQARNLYGIILCCLNRDEEALQQWKFSLRYQPNEVVTKVCLGRLYLHQQEYLKSIDFFKQTLDDDGDNMTGRRLNLAEAHVRASSLSEARSLLGEIDDAETNPRYHYIWTLLHVAANDHFLAFASLNRCISLGQEHGHPALVKIDWPGEYQDDDAASKAIASALPILNSIFDALSMLKSLNRQKLYQSDELTEFNSDII